VREIYGVLTCDEQLFDGIRYKLASIVLNVVPYYTVINAHL